LLCQIVWTYAVNEEGYTEGKYEIIIFKIALARTMNKKTDMLIEKHFLQFFSLLDSMKCFVVDDNDKHK
jgi:hypothetical protein